MRVLLVYYSGGLMEMHCQKMKLLQLVLDPTVQCLDYYCMTWLTCLHNMHKAQVAQNVSPSWQPQMIHFHVHDKSISQSVGQSVGGSVGRWVGRSVGWPVSCIPSYGAVSSECFTIFTATNDSLPGATTNPSESTLGKESWWWTIT